MALEVYFGTRQEKSEYPRSIATAAAFEQQRQEAIRAAKSSLSTTTEANQAKAVRLAAQLADAARAQARNEPAAPDFNKAGRGPSERPALRQRKPRGHDHER